MRRHLRQKSDREQMQASGSVFHCRVEQVRLELHCTPNNWPSKW